MFPTSPTTYKHESIVIIEKLWFLIDKKLWDDHFSTELFPVCLYPSTTIKPEQPVIFVSSSVIKTVLPLFFYLHP